MKTNQEITAVFDLKSIQEQSGYSFNYGNSVIKIDSNDNPLQLKLVISGKRNIGPEKLKNTFFLIWEMLYFFNGFFPTLLSISFNREEDKFFPKKMARQWTTANNISATRSSNRLCFISPETLNNSTLTKYSDLKAALSYPLQSLFAIQSYDGIYSEHRFLLASQAAEGIIEEKYDDMLKRSGFQARIEFLFEPLLVANRKHRTKLFSSIGIPQKIYFKLIKDTRHFYSHLAKERKRFKKGVEFISDYWILSLAIRMFILQEIGIAYDESLFKTNASSIARWINEHRKSHKPTSS